MPPEYIAVGRILRPHGVRGELVLESLTDFPERLAQTETVYVGRASETPEACALDGVRFHRGRLLVRLAGCLDRESAEAYRGMLVQVRADSVEPPPPGAFYVHQILGLSVVTDAGEALGEVAEVIETGANDVYVVRGDQGEVLLPAIRSVILAVDLEARRMTVHLLDGLR